MKRRTTTKYTKVHEMKRRKISLGEAETIPPFSCPLVPFVVDIPEFNHAA